MLTIEQIRAARALLDWSQSDLAEHAGLSQTGIARIENRTNQPNSKTLKKIQAAFDDADIEFMGRTGLRKRSGEIKIYNGREGFRKFMDDVYKIASNKGGEICLFNGMPNLMIKWLGEDWYENHNQRMSSIKENFDFRIIIRHGDKNLIASDFAKYRWFPEKLFHEHTIYSYGNRLAFISMEEENVHIQVLKQIDFAESFRILFNIAWETMAVSFNGH